jgi:hypothetical protein
VTASAVSDLRVTIISQRTPASRGADAGFTPVLSSALEAYGCQVTTMDGGGGHVELGGHQADVTVSSVAAASAIRLSSGFARRLRAPLGLVVHELPDVQEVSDNAAEVSDPSVSSAQEMLTHLREHASAETGTIAVTDSALISRLIHGGVDAGRIIDLTDLQARAPSLHQRRMIRRHLGRDEDLFVATCALNLIPGQDIPLVLAAWRYLARRRGIQLEILTSPRRRDDIALQVGDLPNVNVVSPASSREFGDRLNACDVLLLSDPQAAGMPDARAQLSEYLFTERPVIAALRPGGSWSQGLTMIKDCHFEVSADARELASRIVDLKTFVSPRMLDARGRRGCELARKQLARRPSAMRLVEFIEHLSAKRDHVGESPGLTAPPLQAPALRSGETPR